MTVRKASILSFLTLFTTLAFVACGAGAAPSGDCLGPGPDGALVPVECPANGQPTPTPTAGPGNGVADPGLAVYRNSGCGSCHVLEGVSSGAVGPALTNAGAVAADRVPGLSAEEYLRQAIVAPEEFVVPGYPGGVMPGFYGTQLSEQQINDLVTFLAARR